MELRGIVFDLGHTLAVLDGMWPDVFRRGAVDLAAFVAGQGLGLKGGDGTAVGEELLRRRAEGFARARATRREVTAEETMRSTLAQFGLDDAEPGLVRGALDAFFAYEDRCWHAVPQAVEVLRELSERGLRLGLLSNATDDRFIQRLVDRLGFRPWLAPALTSAGIGVRKPDPAAWDPFLAAWGVVPGAVAMVGDTLEEDIVGAQRAGLHSVWLAARPDARQEGAGAAEGGEPVVPDFVIGRLEEVVGVADSR